MNVLQDKHLTWVPVFLLITVMSFSFTGQAESVTDGKLILPEGIVGHQIEESDPPMGQSGATPEHSQNDNSINVQSHPISQPNLKGKDDEESEKPVLPAGPLP